MKRCRSPHLPFGILAGILVACPLAAFAAERRIDAEVIVKCSLDEAWHCWTTQEGWSWFYPVEANIELRPGGPYELMMGMKEPDDSGRRGNEGCRVLSFVPKEMLSFEWSFPPAVPELRLSNAKTFVVLRFDEVEEGVEKGVRVRFPQLGFEQG